MNLSNASSHRRVWINAGIALMLAGFFGAFFLARYQTTLPIGFCCADDSYFAMIAKTFAETGKYGLPAAWNNVRLFDPSIGAGPAFLLPEALLIRLFGIDYRIPGLTVLLFQAVQTLVLLLILARRFGLARSGLYLAVALYTMAYFAVQQNYFGINIGEVPMLGFLMIGIACLAGQGDRRPNIILGGLALGLAVLTKQAAAFPVAGICAGWSIDCLLKTRMRGVGQVSLLAAAALLPVLVFEFIRWQTLGADEFLLNWKEILAVQQSFRKPDATLWTVFEVLHNTYRIHIGVLATLALSCLFIAFKKNGGSSIEDTRKADIRRMAVLLLSGIIAGLGSFILSRWTNPRYAWLVAMFLAYLLSLPLLSASWIRSAVLLVAIATLVQLPGTFFEETLKWNRRPSENTMAERRTVLKYISDIDRDIPIYGQSWHSTFDIFYFLPPDRHWYLSNEEADVGARDAIYVAFSRFSGVDYPMYKRLREVCQRQLAELTQFDVFLCKKANAPPADPKIN